MVILLSGSRLSKVHCWLQESKPGPYVTDMKEATQFYGNRIMKDFKEKCVSFISKHFYNSCHPDRDQSHVEWVRAYTSIFDDLKKYVMEYHTTGLVWNAKARNTCTFPNNLWADEPYHRVYLSLSIKPQSLQVRLVAPRRRRHHLDHHPHRLLFLLPPPLVVASRRCLPSSIAEMR